MRMGPRHNDHCRSRATILRYFKVKKPGVYTAGALNSVINDAMNLGVVIATSKDVKLVAGAEYRF